MATKRKQKTPTPLVPPIANRRAWGDLRRWRRGAPSVKLRVERDTLARWCGDALRMVRKLRAYRVGRPRRHPVRDEVHMVLRARGAATPARVVWNALRQREGAGIIVKVEAAHLRYVDDGETGVLRYGTFQKLVSEERTRLRSSGLP